MDHVTTGQIAAFRHNRLVDPERRRVAEHLATCSACSGLAAADSEINGAAASIRDDLTGAEHPELDDLFAYVDGELPPRQAKAISTHLRDCPRCREDVDDASRERAQMHRGRWREWLPIAAAVVIVAGAAAWLMLRPVRPPALPRAPRATIAQPSIADEVRRAGSIPMPNVLRDLRGGSGMLRGISPPAADAEMSPDGVVVASDRPELTWRTSAAERAIVTVMCNDSIVAVSGITASGRWTPEHPLPRGSRCVWQLERLPDHTIIPQPPAAQPAFRIMDSQSLASVERADGDDFLAGILFARTGAQQEAEEHLQRYVQAHPADARARGVLESVRRW